LIYFVTNQFLVYANVVNILEKSTNTIKENADTIFDTVKEVDIEVNAEKTKYMSMFHY